MSDQYNREVGYRHDHTPMTPSVIQGIYRRWLAFNGLLYG